jgi:hypothetical protein
MERVCLSSSLDPLNAYLFVGFLISFFLIPGRYFTPLSQKGRRVGGEGN